MNPPCVIELCLVPIVGLVHGFFLLHPPSNLQIIHRSSALQCLHLLSLHHKDQLHIVRCRVGTKSGTAAVSIGTRIVPTSTPTETVTTFAGCSSLSRWRLRDVLQWWLCRWSWSCVSNTTATAAAVAVCVDHCIAIGADTTAATAGIADIVGSSPTAMTLWWSCCRRRTGRLEPHAAAFFGKEFFLQHPRKGFIVRGGWWRHLLCWPSLWYR